MAATDRYQRLNESMHRRFDATLGAETVSEVLERTAGPHAGSLGFFRSLLVERVMVELLTRRVTDAEAGAELPYPLSVSVVGVDGVDGRAA